MVSPVRAWDVRIAGAFSAVPVGDPHVIGFLETRVVSRGEIFDPGCRAAVDAREVPGGWALPGTSRVQGGLGAGHVRAAEIDTDGAIWRGRQGCQCRGARGRAGVEAEAGDDGGCTSEGSCARGAGAWTRRRAGRRRS